MALSDNPNQVVAAESNIDGRDFVSYPTEILDVAAKYVRFGVVRPRRVNYDSANQLIEAVGGETISNAVTRNLRTQTVLESVHNIYLPMPDNLQHTDNHEYADFNGGFLESVFVKSAQDSGFLEGLFALSGELAGRTLLNRFGDNGNLLQQKAGIAFNPRQSTVFKSPSLKIYQFSFPMIATSAKESEAIREIIQRFRYHSHPDVFINSDDSIFDVPDQFLIQFVPGDYLFEIKSPCVLTNMSVTYNGSSTPKFFEETGAPVEVLLTMDFKETEVYLKRDFISNIAKYREATDA